MYSVQYSNKALKSLNRLAKKWQYKITTAIDLLSKNPFCGKKLQGELLGLYSLRIWPYRVIYLIEKKRIRVIIVDIGHRQEIYK